MKYQVHTLEKSVSLQGVPKSKSKAAILYSEHKSIPDCELIVIKRVSCGLDVY